MKSIRPHMYGTKNWWPCTVRQTGNTTNIRGMCDCISKEIVYLSIHPRQSIQIPPIGSHAGGCEVHSNMMLHNPIAYPQSADKVGPQLPQAQVAAAIKTV
jgi:hypothetical protein